VIGYDGGSYLPLINHGTITADASGSYILIFGTNWTNSGTVQATASDTVELAGSWTNTGTLAASGGGDLALEGTWTNPQPITVSNATADFGGTWTNTGPVTLNTGSISLGGTSNLAADAGFGLSGSGGTVSFEGTLNNTGTTLALNDASLTYLLDGGTIDGGTVATSNGATLVGTNHGGQGGTLAGVTLDGTLDLATNIYANLTVTGGLTLDGTIDIGKADGSTLGHLNFVGAQTLGGTGSVLFGTYAWPDGYEQGNQINTAASGGDSGTLTIGPGITIHGSTGVIGYDNGSYLPLINHGTISADASGSYILIFGTNWTNSGTVQATASDEVELAGSWTNTGTLAASGGGDLALEGTWSNPQPITASNATVEFGGTWTNTGPITVNTGSVHLGGTSILAADAGFGLGGSGGTVYFEGSLNNTGTTLALNDPSLTYLLYGGTITGGTMATTNGATLVGTNHSVQGGTLAGVTLDGTLDLATNNAANITVTGGLTLDGTIGIGKADGTTYGRLNFVGAQTLGGTGSVLFGAARGNQINTATSGGDSGTLSIGPGITIHGSTGVIGYDNGSYLPLINHGTITADASGSYILIFGTNWTNAGALQAKNGGELSLNASLTNSGTIEADTGSILGVNGTWTSSGTITANDGTVSLSGTGTNTGTLESTNGGALSSSNGALTNTGVVESEGNSTVNLNSSSVTWNTPGVLIAQPSATVNISGSVFGNTTDVDLFEPQGPVHLDGSGTSSVPQFVEVMSKDVGNVPAGFNKNFVYNVLAVGPNDYVRLVDLQNNSGSSSPEALYVNTLIVPSGATLDLNGLHLYYRAAEINGTIVAGSATRLAGGGPFPLNTSNPGNLQYAGEVDKWSFFDRKGQSVDIFLHTGNGGTPSPIQPPLDFGQVTLIDPSGHVMAVATNGQSGADASILKLVLPVDGTYQLVVQAPPGNPSSTGNYVVAAFDATTYGYQTNMTQVERGQIGSPYSTDQWTFSAAAKTQIAFNLIASATPALQFSLTGPNGFTGFTNVSSGSGLLTLPMTGTYVLTANSSLGGSGAYSFSINPTTQTDLTLGTAYQGSLVGNVQAELFQIAVPQSQGLLLVLKDLSSADQNELYLKFGSLPTRSDYQYRFSNPASANQQILVPVAAAGNWYALLYTDSVPSPSTYTILATTSQIFLTGSTPIHSGTSADTTLTLTGSGFDQTTSVDLIATNGTAYPASKASIDLPTQITVTFDAGTVPAGVYSIEATKPGLPASKLNNALTIDQGGEAQLQTSVVLPSFLGVHSPGTIYVDYRNTGDVAMPAPLLTLSGTLKPFLTMDASLEGSGLWTSALPAGFSHSVEFLASGATPGILQPGESMQVPVYYAGQQQPWDLSQTAISFKITVTDPTEPTAIDWSSLKAGLEPPGIDPTTWAAIYPGLTAQIGTTWGDFVARLDQDASYLYQLGENVTDVSQLWQFEIRQAIGLTPVSQIASNVDFNLPAPGLQLDFGQSYSPSILDRNVVGPLGVGWSLDGPWQETLTTLSDGSVVVSGPNGLRREFQPDSRNAAHAFAQPGDHGTLITNGAGTFTLQETDGSQIHFLSDGQVDYIRDTNGNHITAGYTGNLLTSLTHSDGQSLQILYNEAGRIVNIIDPFGRQTHFTYDPTNTFLLSVQNYDGTGQTYTYDTNSGPAANALLSAAFTTGVTQSFSYDALGRLAHISENNDAVPIAFMYGQSGEVDQTDANGHKTQYFFDNHGLLIKITDALGNAQYLGYDSTFNLIQTTDAAGRSYVYMYDASGNVTNITDSLGSTIRFTNGGPFDQPTSMTDANGNVTNYSYGDGGNLISTTYANGSVSTATYDAQGDPTTTTSPKGDPINYTYNAEGQITSTTFSNGTSETYSYDAHGNLIQTSDATGKTAYSYDSNDRLIQVTEPNGLYLKFAYDAAGRRTSSVDQTGYQLSYQYDSLGRLASISDGTGAKIVSYTYDTDDRLTRKDMGNGTYTTYEYDADGRILDLINYAPNGTINSRFDYTYDSRGRVTSMNTLQGTWSYTYDDLGQLTGWTAPDGTYATYTYDAMGNRLLVDENGLKTSYATNNMNQYTTVGGVTYTYDANGNLIREQSGSDISTYSYDLENRLIAVTRVSDTRTFTYDVLGNLVASTVNGVETRNMIDPIGLGNVVSRYDGSGNLIARYSLHFPRKLGRS
jgi:YD repeat-containing protein